MDIEPPPTLSSDSNSNSEYLDAESDDDVGAYPMQHELEVAEQQQHSIIYEIREELAAAAADSATTTHRLPASQSFSSEQSKTTLNNSVESLTISSTTTIVSDTGSSAAVINDDDDAAHDYQHDSIWRGQKKHIFVLSEAGKPIYSLHGKEDKLATLFGVIQALVSYVQHNQDAITSIHAQGIKFVFMVRNSLILVAASRSKMSVPQLQMQLSDVYNQVLCTLTYSHIQKTFERRKNFDLRQHLTGSERLLNHLLSGDSSSRVSHNVFSFLTNAIPVLPLPTSVRANIVSAIQSNCSKIKTLVFAVLIANNKLITLVRMKKHSIHPADLRLIFNLIECSESFKSSENWTPICLPRFDMNGYLHAHVSYLADDCQACLLLMSVDRDIFFTLSEAKQRITDKLRRSHCLEAINEALSPKLSKLDIMLLNLPELRHFIYKPKNMAQLLCAQIQPPYHTLKGFEHLEGLYCKLLHNTHSTSQPLKLIYQRKDAEVLLAWVTAGYELYAVFEPFVEQTDVINTVDKLIKWIQKEFDVYFIKTHPNF